MAEDETAEPSAKPRVRRSAPKRGGTILGIRAHRWVEGAYVVLLGFLIMRLIFVLITPIEAPETASAGSGPAALDADVSVFARFDPFGSSADAAPREQSYAGAAETTLNLRLVGVTFGGGISTALIELSDGKQRSVTLGDEVMGGVTLRDVLPNQAILSRDGVTETLTLKDRDGRPRTAGAGNSRDLPPSRRAASAGGPGAPARAGPATPGQALDMLSQALRFEPIRGEDGGIAGYQLTPGSAPALFEAAGFAQGDIVTSVDGMAAPQDPERLLELMADLPPGRPFTVTVEREGTPLDVPVDLSRAP